MNFPKRIVLINSLVILISFTASFISIVRAQSGQVDGWWTDNSGVNHQCPPDCGGSASSSSGSAMDTYNAYSSAYNLGAQLWSMGQNQQSQNQAEMLRVQELQRQEAARIAQENQLRREEEERQRKIAHAQLLSELALIDNRGEETLPLMGMNSGKDLGLLPMDDDPKLKPAGTAFFGLGGGKDSGQVMLEDNSAPVALLREPMLEQSDFTRISPELLKNEQQLIEQRIEEPNKWCSGIYASLKTKAPPLPYKKFNELQPGDVLLIKADGFGSGAINKIDNLLSGDKTSNSSHTVLYLKEVNGKKHFLENIPWEGPRIIFEDEFLKRYSARGAQVAKLAQPLNEKEAKQLYSAAVEMAAKNRKDIVGTKWLGTDYGVWREDNVVCSESDWAVLKIAGREIPKSSDRLKKGLGIDFSPADFFNKGQYFFVSPIDMPK